MENLKNKKVKELVKDYPELLDVLNEYNIPCATCKKHNCALKDVAEAEELSMEEEIELEQKINKVLSKIKK